MKGPFPIFCRGHSGGRLLCEAFIENNFWMGITNPRTKDDAVFSQRNPTVQHLLANAFIYPTLPEDEKTALQQTLRSLVDESKNKCPDPESRIAYGWKRGITTFLVEIFMDAFPQSKAIHLIRDGRDVMLSRLNSRMKQLSDDPLNKSLVFGDAEINEYNGLPLNWKTVKTYRNEIEMHHWVTATEFGMKGRSYPGRYLEIFYEDLCRQPVETLAKVFDFLEVPFLPGARNWIAENASPKRIGKWTGQEHFLHNAIKVGEPLLKKLGYLQLEQNVLGG